MGYKLELRCNGRMQNPKSSYQMLHKIKTLKSLDLGKEDKCYKSLLISRFIIFRKKRIFIWE